MTGIQLNPPIMLKLLAPQMEFTGSSVCTIMHFPVRFSNLHCYGMQISTRQMFSPVTAGFDSPILVSWGTYCCPCQIGSKLSETCTADRRRWIANENKLSNYILDVLLLHLCMLHCNVNNNVNEFSAESHAAMSKCEVSSYHLKRSSVVSVCNKPAWPLAVKGTNRCLSGGTPPPPPPA
jgi:hypothetical protein